MQKIWRHLEDYYCTPEFGGGMLMMLSGFFFAAATNTLSGWLYVISGVSFALLLISAVLPRRGLRHLIVERSPMEPVSVGEVLTVIVTIKNSAKAKQSLVQVLDHIPWVSDLAFMQVIEEIDSQPYQWIYSVATAYRGVFWFDRLDLVTASPFGLFRSRRLVMGDQLRKKAIVYPHVLTLNQCPLIDQMGTEETPKTYSQRYVNANANEGLTKALRPYRWGDPTRLIHWRSSAKFGELKIRELEITLSGQDLVIALDSDLGWQSQEFEEAVVTAASLYFYAQGLNIDVKLWTGEHGIIQGQKFVLEVLAGIYPKAGGSGTKLPDLPTVWLTHRPESLARLGSASRWVLWSEQKIDETNGIGLVIQPSDGSELAKDAFTNLRSQLQRQVKIGTNLRD